MSNKNLYIMVGIPGSGKSTWLAQNAQSPFIISRDSIRFKLRQPGDGYFDHEKEVFKTYTNLINNTLAQTDRPVYADATHISQASRNKLLNKLDLDDVDIHIVFINASVQQAIAQNDLREGQERVPESIIQEAYERCEPPSFSEKYRYKSILEVR